MKQTYFYILLFLAQVTLAQTTIDNIHADYIMIDRHNKVTFLKKEKGKIKYKTEIRFYPTDNALGKKVETKMAEVTDFDLQRFNEISNDTNQYTKIIKVSSVKKQKNKELLTFLENQRFYNQLSVEEIYRLNYYNKAFFTSSECEYYKPNIDSHKEWGCNDKDLISFVIINLNNKNPIVIFPYIKPNYTFSEHHRSDEKYLIKYLGFIIPQKNQSLIKYYDKIITYSKQHQTFDLLKGSKFKEDKTPQWSFRYEFKDSYLKDRVFGQKLIDKKFDTIMISNGFIVGQKNDLVDIYNLELKNITPQSLKSAFALLDRKEYSICLIDNEIKYLSRQGKVINELPAIVTTKCGFYDEPLYPHYFIEKSNINYFLTISYTDIDFDGNEVTKKLEYPIFDKSEYHSVYFLNNYNREFYGNSEYIIVEKDGKHGLFTIKVEREPNQNAYGITHNIDLKEILPVEFDEIKHVSGTSHILFSKENLFGILGLNDNLKYKEIEVSEYFSRFRLPNGQKGWLDKLGNEFMDE